MSTAMAFILIGLGCVGVMIFFAEMRRSGCLWACAIAALSWLAVAYAVLKLWK